VPWVRDMDFDEDRSQVRTASGPPVLDLMHQERHERTLLPSRGRVFGEIDPVAALTVEDVSRIPPLASMTRLDAVFGSAQVIRTRVRPRVSRQ
jgi:hypothetical protein